ncbi:PASTA domain-containing protein [Plantactinospora sp. WMMB782]|uniref:PASTA domain-containing protein n=1 Tax=Plantactinospora sp. WMMB782 TaxID=3404121 RepID=UPI003B954261
MSDDPRQPSDDDRGVDGDRGVSDIPGNQPPPAAGPTAAGPTAGPDDATSRIGETRRQPGTPEATAPIPPREPAWSGRAGVPPRGVQPPRQPQPEWGYDPDPDDRRWWMPILIGTVAVILLGVLAAAGWWIVDSARRDGPAAPSPTATSPAPTPTTVPPTTPPPSTPAPTPSATAGTPVLVPPLVGLSQQEAVAELEQLGLVARIRPQTSGRLPGTVLDTDPSTGTELERGAEVVLVVAVPPTGAPTTEPGPVGPTQPTPGG